jgi:CHAT domain-containing protein
VSGDWARADDPAPVADELAAALRLDELLADLPAQVRRLAVVADDALHGFPFAALRVGGRYLVERFALSHQSGTRPDARAGRPVSSALVAAIPDGAPPSDEFPEGVPPLPNAAAEAEDVRRRLERLGVSVDHRGGGDGAPALLAALSAAGFAHVAGHGVFAPVEPDRSGLVVVGRSGVGRLTLRDLYAADLGRIEHLTLSCCWGADNFVYPGRRVLSLPEAATRAGAGSVLAALWPVHDAVAREFTGRFLDSLRDHPRDVALQRTQCDFLRSVPRVPDRKGEGGKALPVAHPYYWAGYRLFGRTGRIRWARGG